MSCWVVPSVAADFWGISVEQLMESVRRGEVSSREEYQFLLVDVAPNSPQIPAPQPRDPKPTYRPADSDNDTNASPLNFQAARRRTQRLRRAPVAHTI